MGVEQWERSRAVRASEETREAISDTRPPIGRLVRWVVVSLLVFHGLIHLLGPVEIWAIADLEELTGQPVIDLGQSVTNVLAGASATGGASVSLSGQPVRQTTHPRGPSGAPL